VKRVLVIEDEETLRRNILELLVEEGFEAVGASDGKAGIAMALQSSLTAATAIKRGRPSF
jgi:DNA-binding response OmpR family regulator